MEDRVIMDNILSVIKGDCELLLHGTIESTTPNVHETFKSSLNDALQIQNEIYSLMSQKGWYPSTQAEQQKIDQAKQNFSMF